MTRPNPKYMKFEAYMNGWDAYCHDKRNPTEKLTMEDKNPYDPNYEKFSHDCWNQGYVDSTGRYVVWDFFIY